MMFCEVQITPIACLIVGIVLLLICGLEFVIVLLQPRRLLKRRWLRPRWGDCSDGPPVSHLAVQRGV